MPRHLTLGLRGSRTAMRVVAVLAIAVAGCSRANQPETDVEPRPDPIPIHVKNENFLDMNVAVLAGGVSRRLGQVSGNGSSDFQVTWSVVNGQQVQLTATPIGGSGRFTSGGISVRPGQIIEMRIGSVLRQSVAVVREP